MAAVSAYERRLRVCCAEAAGLVKRAVRESRPFTDRERVEFERLLGEKELIERDLEAAFYGDAGEGGDRMPVEPRSPSGAPGTALEPPTE